MGGFYSLTLCTGVFPKTSQHQEQEHSLISVSSRRWSSGTSRSPTLQYSMQPPIQGEPPSLKNKGCVDFSSAFSLKIKCFSKTVWLQEVSLQNSSPGCRIDAHQLWTREARRPVSATKPHVRARDRQFLLLFTPFHVPSSAFHAIGRSHSRAPPKQQRGCSDATAVALLHRTWDRDGPHTHITSPTSQHNHRSSTPKHAEAQETPARLPIQPSCQGRP